MDKETILKMNDSLWSIEYSLDEICDNIMTMTPQECWEYIFNISELLSSIMKKQIELENKLNAIAKELQIDITRKETDEEWC